jgi:hypothetical protein
VLALLPSRVMMLLGRVVASGSRAVRLGRSSLSAEIPQTRPTVLDHASVADQVSDSLDVACAPLPRIVLAQL